MLGSSLLSPKPRGRQPAGLRQCLVEPPLQCGELQSCYPAVATERESGEEWQWRWWRPCDGHLRWQ